MRFWIHFRSFRRFFRQRVHRRRSLFSNNDLRGKVNDDRFLKVVPTEERTEQDCLHSAANDGDHVEVSLEIVSEYPVGDVQSPIKAEGGNVERDDGFHLPNLADHEELRQERESFQMDGESPKTF